MSIGMGVLVLMILLNTIPGTHTALTNFEYIFFDLKTNLMYQWDHLLNNEPWDLPDESRLSSENLDLRRQSNLTLNPLDSNTGSMENQVNTETAGGTQPGDDGDWGTWESWDPQSGSTGDWGDWSDFEDTDSTQTDSKTETQATTATGANSPDQTNGDPQQTTPPDSDTTTNQPPKDGRGGDPNDATDEESGSWEGWDTIDATDTTDDTANNWDEGEPASEQSDTANADNNKDGDDDWGDDFGDDFGDDLKEPAQQSFNMVLREHPTEKQLREEAFKRMDPEWECSTIKMQQEAHYQVWGEQDNQKIQSPIMIIGIDEGTLTDVISKEVIGDFPFKRSVYAGLIENFRIDDEHARTFFKNAILYKKMFFDKIPPREVLQNADQYAQEVDALMREKIEEYRQFQEDVFYTIRPELIFFDVFFDLPREDPINPDDPTCDDRKLANELEFQRYNNQVADVLEPTQIINRKDFNQATIDKLLSKKSTADNLMGYIYMDFLTETHVGGQLDLVQMMQRWRYTESILLQEKKSPDDPNGHVYDPNNYKESMQLIRQMKPPIACILQNTSWVGAAAVESDSDNSRRRMPFIFRFRDNRIMNEEAFILGVDLVLLMKYYSVTRDELEVILGDSVILHNALVPVHQDPETKTWKVGLKPPPPFYENLVAQKCWGENNPLKQQYVLKDLRIPIDKEGKMLIHFYGPNGSFAYRPFNYFHISFEPKKEWWYSYKNRLMLLGYYSSANVGDKKDTHPTPFADMFGIEVHANALQTVITEDYILKPAYLPPPFDGINLEHFIIILLLLLMALLMPRITILQSAITMIVILVLVFLVPILLFVFTNYQLELVNPLITTVLGFLGLTLYRVLTEEKDKAQLRSTFGQYVNPEVVNELIQNPDTIGLGGVDRVMSVFFSDIRGFTSLSESLTPQELVEVLNIYLSKMTDIIMSYNGTLDKYIGDAVMAFWGAPVEDPEHALKACQTALDQLEALKEINKGLPGGMMLDIGIGINTGNMTAGNMGSEIRKNYTVMGDNVNLGSRLEGACKTYGVRLIISEYTYEQCKDSVIVRELDLVRVKGKKLPVRIYELLDIREGHRLIPRDIHASA